MNPVAAPRYTPCRVCDLVAVPGDVTIRLFDADLNHLPLDSAVEYLRAVGFAGTVRQLQAFSLTHRRHVDRYIDHEGAMAPAQVEPVTRLPPAIEKAGWVDVNQAVMNTGMQASELIAERLRTGAAAIEMRDLVSIQASGSMAAARRADLELKGLLKRGESVARIAAGIDRPVE